MADSLYQGEATTYSLVQSGEISGHKVGREYVAMRLPLAREEKSALVEKMACKRVMLSGQMADHLRDRGQQN